VPAFAGCSKADKAESTASAEPAAAKVPTVTVDQADSIFASQGQAVDANAAPTRKSMGVIPGAVLLTDSDSYKLTELPGDKSKPLVFYCANTACGASHHAADKAIAAGYSNVKVMPEGIAGWVKAGKKTAQI